MGVRVDPAGKNCVGAQVIDDGFGTLQGLGIDTRNLAVFDEHSGVAQDVAASVEGSAHAKHNRSYRLLSCERERSESGEEKGKLSHSRGLLFLARATVLGEDSIEVDKTGSEASKTGVARSL